MPSDYEITMHDLTAFQRDLLRLIGGMDDPKGLAVKKELEDYYAQEVNHGRLYPNLDELVEKGLVHKEEVDGRTNSYSITDRGVRELHERDKFNEEYAPEKTVKALKAD